MRKIHFIQLSNFLPIGQKRELAFLDAEDTLLNNGMTVLSSDLFVKPTGTYKFLNRTSCHPHHCNRGYR